MSVKQKINLKTDAYVYKIIYTKREDEKKTRKQQDKAKQDCDRTWCSGKLN